MTNYTPRRVPAIAWLCGAAILSACASDRPPAIAYDDDVPPLIAPPSPGAEVPPPPLHTPPGWVPSRGGTPESQAPQAQVVAANAAARVEPRRAGYHNAIQVFPYSEGALYQVYAAPGQISDIALQPGERLTGIGPIAAGDTARWIIGDTTSGQGAGARVHVMVKPTRPDIRTNLVLNTDRRSYLIELIADEEAWMPAVAWAYPTGRAFSKVPPQATGPSIPAPSERRYRYALSGDAPPWRPRSVFDDGRRVYIVFPPGISQGEMPPIFVIGPDGDGQIANTRVWRNVLIVDRLFATAELRLGADAQEVVRIDRTDGRTRR